VKKISLSQATLARPANESLDDHHQLNIDINKQKQISEQSNSFYYPTTGIS
jgi:hypothetical protein